MGTPISGNHHIYVYIYISYNILQLQFSIVQCTYIPSDCSSVFSRIHPTIDIISYIFLFILLYCLLFALVWNRKDSKPEGSPAPSPCRPGDLLLQSKLPGAVQTGQAAGPGDRRFFFVFFLNDFCRYRWQWTRFSEVFLGGSEAWVFFGVTWLVPGLAILKPQLSGSGLEDPPQVGMPGSGSWDQPLLLMMKGWFPCHVRQSVFVCHDSFYCSLIVEGWSRTLFRKAGKPVWQSRYLSFLRLLNF